MSPKITATIDNDIRYGFEIYQIRWLGELCFIYNMENIRQYITRMTKLMQIKQTVHETSILIYMHMA